MLVVNNIMATPDNQSYVASCTATWRVFLTLIRDLSLAYLTSLYNHNHVLPRRTLKADLLRETATP